MSTEDPESYLRRFAETQLRRLAAGDATAAECASRVDAVTAAFEGTGVLDRELAEDIAADLDLALAARSPERGTMLHTGRRAQMSALRDEPGFAFRSRPRVRARAQPPGEVSVVPAGAALRSRNESANEEVYLLSFVATPGQAWLSVAARTTQLMVPRRHASPPSSRNPRTRPANPLPSTFAGGMTAVDDAGRKYDLTYSGGGGPWYLGRLSVSPVPPPDIAWLEVHCGGESARLDLSASAPAAKAEVRPRAGGPGEAYLLRRAEALLGYARDQTGRLRVISPSPAAHLRAPSPGPAAHLRATVTGLASAVPALRAVGLLPAGSPVPGQLAALAEAMGAPGRLIAETGDLPERWAAALKPGPPAEHRESVAAAHLTAVLPEADGTAVQLAGLVTLPGEGTLIFGTVRASSEGGGQSLWLRDDAGGWHSVSIRGWSVSGSSSAFQAAVEPPLGPETSRVEFYVIGSDTEVRAGIPLTWWLT